MALFLTTCLPTAARAGSTSDCVRDTLALHSMTPEKARYIQPGERIWIVIPEGTHPALMARGDSIEGHCALFMAPVVRDALLRLQKETGDWSFRSGRFEEVVSENNATIELQQRVIEQQHALIMNLDEQREIYEAFFALFKKMLGKPSIAH